MRIFFYSDHTLYAKVLIPIVIRLAKAGHAVRIFKNKPDLLKYNPRNYALAPSSNRFVNKSSFDYIAGLCGYADEWGAVRDRVGFTFFRNPGGCDAIFGTTKNLDILKDMRHAYPKKEIFAIGYQHMPFILSLGSDFKKKDLPDEAVRVFTRLNPFSATHKFPEYIAQFKISFRGFPYIEKIYNDYYIKYLENAKRGGISKKYVLIFHPGGYRGVITQPGEGRESSYAKQRDFLITICGPILEKNLVPVVKIHPMAARHHFKEDVLKILDSISTDRKEFSKVIVEDENYFKYVYESDTVVTFGSSSVYELFSMNVPNLIICGFFGKSRSGKFSFLKGIFINSADEYRDFWKRDRALYFSNAYKEDSILGSVYRSYSSLFRPDITEKIIEDIGIT